MGQNSSQPHDNFGKRSRPPARPTQLPQRSKSLSPPRPSYAVDENLVLPFPIGERQLRPVSAELSNVYPEYTSVFIQQEQISPIEDDARRSSRENIRPRREDGPTYVRSRSYPDHDERIREDRARGKLRDVTTVMNEEEPENSLKRSNTFTGDSSPKQGDQSSLKFDGGHHERSQSLDRKQNRRIRGHKRYPSISTNLTNPENTILEDPSEPAYFPLQNPSAMSYSGISLPKQSTFDMDYKYQLTYTQLAEHRRGAHLAEIEKKTGRKLQDLSDDLAENIDWGNAYNTSPQVKRQHSDSMKSGTSGQYSTLEKQSKKKARAPPPPKQKGKKKPIEIHGHRRCPEPDYDMTGVSPPRGFEDTRDLEQNRSKDVPVSRSSSSVSHYKDKRASDIMNEMLVEKKPLSEIDRRVKRSPSDILDEMLLVKQKNITSVLSSIPLPPPPPQFADSMTDDNEQGLVITEITDAENKSEAGSRKDNNEVTKTDETSDKPDEEPMEDEKKSDGIIQRQNSIDKGKFPTDQRRMSSLLMYDIVSTAQARTSIIEKKSTPVPSKPKDPHQVFREQLAKACNKREERLKDSSIDDMIPNLNKSPSKEALGIPLLKKTTSEWNKPEEEDETNKDKFRMDWTPVDDLSGASDDGDESRTIATSKGRDTPDGFKSKIIPSKMEEMKQNSRYQKNKNGKSSNKLNKMVDDNANNVNKYGSLRKFKKSVNKGVRNAFGSISKASGKILRRQRQVLDEQETEDVLSNWDLLRANDRENTESDAKDISSTSSLVSPSPLTVHSAPVSPVTIEYDAADDESSSESDLSSDDEPDVKVQTSAPSRRKYSSDADVDEAANGDILDASKNNMKRAGIAYISKNGQIVVLPEYETSSAIDKEGRAPKIVNRKKKKFTFESSVKKKEKLKLEEQISEHIKERESHLDDERKKQIEMELEFRKLRELEAKEKLQKLQTAHIQQQLSAALAQQHVTDMRNSMLPQTSLVPSFGQQNPLAALFNHQSMSSPQLASVGLSFANNSGFPSGQVFGSTTGIVTDNSYDYVSEYMKMLSTNKSPTPQQYAYMLNKINWRSTSFDDPTTYSIPLLNGSVSSMDLNNGDIFPEEQKQLLIKKIVNAKLAETLVDDSDTHKASVVSHDTDSDRTDLINGSQLDIGDSASLKNNPIYSSSDDDDNSNRVLLNVLKPKLSYINKVASDSTSSSSVSANSSPRIPTKAYGPVAYRPVAFDPAKSKRRQFAEHEESNDSGISER